MYRWVDRLVHDPASDQGRGDEGEIWTVAFVRTETTRPPVGSCTPDQRAGRSLNGCRDSGGSPSIGRPEVHLVDHAGEWWFVGGRRVGGEPSGRVDRLGVDGVVPGPPLPPEWQPAAVVSLCGALWAIGGTRRPHEPVATVRVLSDEDDEWAPGPRLPRPLRDPGAVSMGGGLLVAGGLGAGSIFGPSEWLRDAWWIGPRDDRWRPVCRLPEPRIGGALLEGPPGHAIWVGGANPEGEADGALVWDGAADAWSSRPCGPPGLGARGVAALSDGTLVLAGGHRTVRDTSKRRFGPDHHPVVGRCHHVDVLGGSITPLPDLVRPRRHAAVVAVDERTVWVVGGQINGRIAHTFDAVDTIEAIDRSAWQVAPIAPLDRPRSAPLVGARGTEVIVVGGTAAGRPVDGFRRARTG